MPKRPAEAAVHIAALNFICKIYRKNPVMEPISLLHFLRVFLLITKLSKESNFNNFLLPQAVKKRKKNDSLKKISQIT